MIFLFVLCCLMLLVAGWLWGTGVIADDWFWTVALLASLLVVLAIVADTVNAPAVPTGENIFAPPLTTCTRPA